MSPGMTDEAVRIFLAREIRESSLARYEGQDEEAEMPTRWVPLPEAVAAVLDAPALGEVWRAEAGKGATLNGGAITHSGRAVFIGARTPTDALPKIDSDLVAVTKPNSIALRIAMVAAGQADLLATIRWGNEWDIAAAVLIAREAGCSVSDAVGRKLRFNTPRAEAFGVLATAPGIHLAAIARLHDHPEFARQLGEAARRKARTQFDESIVIQRTMAVYAELCDLPAASAESSI